MADDCGRRAWAGDCSEISAGRTPAPVLEAGSHSRRCAGGSRGRTSIRAISTITDAFPTGSLGTYVQNFRFNGPVFAALAQVAPPQLLVGLAVLVGLVTATWIRTRSAEPELSPDQFAWTEFVWPMAACLLCAPGVFPWYLLWLLPFLTSASTLLIIIWTVSIFPVYVQWHLRALGRPWGALPVWVMVLEYGCLAVSAVLILWRRTARAGAPRSSAG